MAREKQKKANWSSVKSAIQELEQDEVLDLLRDLYALSPSTKQFFHARLKLGEDRLAPYKKTIQQCMCPDVLRNHSVEISKAKKVIAEFRKASEDVVGEIELMIHFVECGSQFTILYGDIDGPFYDSLLRMYGNAAAAVAGLSEPDRETFRKRLLEIAESCNGIGWGYGDGLWDEYYSAFQDDDD